MADPVLRRHSRSDEGFKRGPRVKRHEVENSARERARSERGTFLPKWSPEQRQAALADALQSLERGETVLDVANRHGIPRSTVEAWLIAGDHEHSPLARSLFYSQQIADCMEGMRTATDPLALAQARDLRRAWAETAAVRDRNFMVRQEITVDHRVTVDHELSESAIELLNKIRGLPAPVRIIEVMSNALPATIEGGVSPSLESDLPPLESGPLPPPLTDSK